MDVTDRERHKPPAYGQIGGTLIRSALRVSWPVAGATAAGLLGNEHVSFGCCGEGI